MNINLKKERLILALMILVIIYLLFFSSVAFGQVSLPQQKYNVSGIVFYSDGKTPLVDNSSLMLTYLTPTLVTILIGMALTLIAMDITRLLMSLQVLTR